MPPAVSPPLLEVEDLGVTFPIGGGWRPQRLHALSGASFTLARGEIVAVVGESGSGKSTLGRLLTRLEQPTSGRIRLDGEDVLHTQPSRPSRAYRSRVQMIFQDPFGSLNPAHTILHHITRPLLIHGKATEPTARQRALTLLETVGLAPASDFVDKHPHALSGGQRQRVAIARALAAEPDLLIADEPTSMLDVSIRMDVLHLLQRLRDERNLALLLITHDLAAARYLADRVLVMYAGQLMEELPAKTLGRRARHPYTRLLVAASPRPGADLHATLPAKSGLPKNIDPQPGCPFADRCHEATDACRTTALVSHKLTDQHRIRCHVHGDAHA
jgi:peptide/nickel transport system ATP-binding protein